MRFGASRRGHAALAAITTLLFTACGLALPTHAADPQKTKSWTIEGRVLDPAGNPVVGAQVFTNQLHYTDSSTTSETTTDAEGYFKLEVTTAPTAGLSGATNPTAAS